MKVQDLFQVLKNTNFCSFFESNPKEYGVHELSKKTEIELLEVQEFSSSDFGSWQYGLSNDGYKNIHYKIIFLLDI